MISDDDIIRARARRSAIRTERLALRAKAERAYQDRQSRKSRVCEPEIQVYCANPQVGLVDRGTPADHGAGYSDASRSLLTRGALRASAESRRVTVEIHRSASRAPIDRSAHDQSWIAAQIEARAVRTALESIDLPTGADPLLPVASAQRDYDQRTIGHYVRDAHISALMSDLGADDAQIAQARLQWARSAAKTADNRGQSRTIQPGARVLPAGKAALNSGDGGSASKRAKARAVARAVAVVDGINASLDATRSVREQAWDACDQYVLLVAAAGSRADKVSARKSARASCLRAGLDWDREKASAFNRLKDSAK